MPNTAESNSIVLDLPLFRLGMDAALKSCIARAADGRGGYACFVNVHSLVESIDDSQTRAALQNAAYAFPDGLPLVWASRLKSIPITERVCGPDFMAALLENRTGEAFGFIGGKAGLAESIGKRFNIRAIAYTPPFRPFTPENALEDWKKFVHQTQAKHGKLPRFVWVCLGAPKQELWMQTVSPVAKGVFFLGVGAAIDFLAGEITRAPLRMQKMGLEWLFRLIQEPRRLWRRYLISNFQFVFQIALDAFKKPKRK
jgi:N-acetylglucosaminyldiphosphoundecaprenol N-acetyl-beta-D-mannosaminyltransferase